MEDSGKKRTVGAVEKTLEIIDALLETDGATLHELSEELDYSKSSIYNHLCTLVEKGYVIKEDGRYRPSLYFLHIGERVRRRYTLIYRYGTEEIKKLAEETGEVSWIGVKEMDQSVFVGKHRGPKAVETGRFPLGRPLPLHCTGCGKAILSQLPKEEVNEILDRTGLPPRAPHTITSREDLFEELEFCREEGYLFESEEVVANIRGVAAPVTEPDGSLVGAVSVTGPISRMKGDRFRKEIPEKVVEAANIIEIKLMRNDTDSYGGAIYDTD